MCIRRLNDNINFRYMNNFKTIERRVGGGGNPRRRQVKSHKSIIEVLLKQSSICCFNRYLNIWYDSQFWIFCFVCCLCRLFMFKYNQYLNLSVTLLMLFGPDAITNIVLLKPCTHRIRAIRGLVVVKQRGHSPRSMKCFTENLTYFCTFCTMPYMSKQLKKYNSTIWIKYYPRGDLV